MITVARLVPQKDFPTLFRALASLDLPWVLDVVGDGPQKESLIALAHSLGLLGKVHFRGSRTDVAEMLTRAHVFVLATKQEGLPLTILEAMRSGLPVVASRVGGVPEAVVHEVTGLLTTPQNPDELNSSLRRLLSSSRLRSRMGSAGREKYERDFTAHRMLTETEAVYRDVLTTITKSSQGHPRQTLRKSNNTS